MDTGTPDTAIGQLKAKAESGETEAQYQLGICLWEGIGMPVDPDAALEWVILAAGGGHAPAQSWLGSLYLSNQDEEQARFWFEKASLQGDGPCHVLPLTDLCQGECFWCRSHAGI